VLSRDDQKGMPISSPSKTCFMMDPAVHFLEDNLHWRGNRHQFPRYFLARGFGGLRISQISPDNSVARLSAGLPQSFGSSHLIISAPQGVLSEL
jgi:hypothetical protein